MPYKVISYTSDAAIGSKVNTDVLCEFTIGSGGSRNLRVEVHSSAGVDTSFKLQTSMDGVYWVDATAAAAQIAAGYAEIVVTEGDAETPLRPLGRLIATAAITTTKVLVAMDR